MDIKRHVDLQPYNTLGVRAKADYFVEVSSLEELCEAIQFSSSRRLRRVFIGGGSNLVLRGDVQGLVIHVALLGISCEALGDERFITVAAGENWDALVKYSLAQGWYGLENLISIPGSAGAAPIQNIGAYGVELANVLVSVTGWDVALNSLRNVSLSDCHLSYRDSVFKGALRDTFIITAITLRLQTSPALELSYPALREALPANCSPTPEIVAETVARIRAEKLPDFRLEPNVGSFFKNPIITANQAKALLAEYSELPHWSMPEGRVKLAAAWLVDQAGWKGRRLGAVGIHPRQAIVLVNYEAASGGEVLALASAIQADVSARFGIGLEIEPRIY
ncbi:UDP-N-acetylmuramate dehydrogenase [Zhongshania guokunii]|uniref:UDP-N-acetylenolpyruvoylglucosamine reductase n=1 Tax=Zhongshania guokunii TaxID=641783 RepID=A0ABV3U1I6_9GAMM